MLEISLDECMASAGPFASSMLEAQIRQEHDPTAAILAVALVLIVVQMPVAGTLYVLATLCNRHESAATVKWRARQVSNAIDERTRGTNRLELLRVKLAGSDGISGGIADPRKSRSDSRVAPHEIGSEQVKGNRVMAREVEKLSTRLEAMDKDLALLSTQSTRTERCVALLIGPNKRRTRMNRAIVFTAMTLLTLMSVPSTILAPFAIMALSHCNDHSPLGERARSGLWLAYVLCCGGPAVVAWAQVIRTICCWFCAEARLALGPKEHVPQKLTADQEQAMALWDIETAAAKKVDLLCNCRAQSWKQAWSSASSC